MTVIVMSVVVGGPEDAFEVIIVTKTNMNLIWHVDVMLMYRIISQSEKRLHNRDVQPKAG